ncbi:MAG: hypothetical protein GXY58_04975 [Planctomycetaceae bacterium]|nr:hypothetical protein [Planctomycetaceae bacterium]
MVDNNLPTGAESVPARRAIVLGASNVSLGLSTVVATAQQAWGAPLEILAAIGHGRSYGQTSSVLGRSLPGILHCGLWDELHQRPPLPTAALVTDIGNDILYGSDVTVILRWVETCLERLHNVCDRLVITRLPLASLHRTPDWRLRLLTSLFFPSSRGNYRDALAKAHEVDQALLSFAGRYRAYIVQPDWTWFGWDPIHIARAHRPVAWQKYFACWTDGRVFSPARRSLRRWLITTAARPSRWTFLGVARECQQPTLRLSDGSTLSLY